MRRLTLDSKQEAPKLPNCLRNFRFSHLFPTSTLLFSSAGSSLPRMLPLSGPAHVEAVFAHTPGASPGGGACLLHFLPGDNITLLISEPRDGWHYGQNERTGRCVSCNAQAEIFRCSSLKSILDRKKKRLNDARRDMVVLY